MSIKVTVRYKVRPVRSGVDYRPFSYYSSYRGALKAARKAFDDKVMTPTMVEIDRSSEAREYSDTVTPRKWDRGFKRFTKADEVADTLRDRREVGRQDNADKEQNAGLDRDVVERWIVGSRYGSGWKFCKAKVKPGVNKVTLVRDGTEQQRQAYITMGRDWFGLKRVFETEDEAKAFIHSKLKEEVEDYRWRLQRAEGNLKRFERKYLTSTE